MSPRRRGARRSRAGLRRRRLLVLAGLCVLGYAGLLVRAVQLQAVDGGQLSLRAARQHESKLRLAPLRGELRDRHGVLLAGSASVSSIAASPRQVRDPGRMADSLARIVDADRAELRRKLRPDRGFVWIQRWVTPEQAERVRRLDLEGVHLHAERKRFYPSRSLAAAYLGFAGRDGEGLSGIELAFDSALRGTGRDLRALRDGRGRKLLDVAAQPRPRSGATVVLAIDAKLQHFAERALERALARTGAQHGAVVALDPRDGDVLAIAQAPGFDPNSFWLAEPSTWRTRALVDGFEPGSTLKPFTVAVALEAGSVHLEDRFDCENGSWRVLDRRIRDWQPHGVLTVRDIVRLSSNIGAAKVADRVGSRALVEGLRAFGFGESTGSGFPGEAAGVVHSLRETQAVERANLAFGQGLTVTALQLASAGAVLANGGERVRPRLALAFERDGERVELPAERGERVVSQSTARAVLGMMRDVVASGTGRRAALPRHAVAGKTGTAQKVVNGRYSDHRFVASFLGIVPVSDPRLVIVIVLDEPRYGRHTGGAAAAPVFAEIAGFAVEQLGLPPGESA